MRTETAIPTRLGDYQPFPFALSRVTMAFALEPQRTLVTTSLKFFRHEGLPETTDLFLHGEDLELVSLKIDGQEAPKSTYRVTDEGLTLIAPPAAFSFESVVAINPQANTKLSGLYMSGGRFCTQCEAEGFRRITYWPDRPDVMSLFHVRIEADATAFPILLSNGNPVAAGMLDEARHFAEWSDPWPKPAYLFALVAGELDYLEDTFVREDGRPVELTIYVDPGAASKAVYAMDALKRSMKWDEEVFGLLYDLDVFNIVAVSDFNFGAMENKGLNIFNSALLLADAETATDMDFELIEAVVAHEYFHNWSGNRVTCRDWFQLSLKEGLTVFRDQEFSSDMRSRAVKRIQDVKRLRARQFQEDAGPLAHPVRPDSYLKIDNFYTATIYEKGAEIIRVALNLLGEKAFGEGCDRYFTNNDGRAATIEDWLIALRGNDPSLLAGIETWYAQAGTPVVTMASTYNPVARTMTLSFSQETAPTPGQADKQPVPIPMQIGFLGQDGKPMRLKLQGHPVALDAIDLNFHAAQTVLTFEEVLQKPIVSALRGFSAPVRLKTNHTTADLAVLAAHDTDAFNRWEAAQTIASRALLAIATDSAEASELTAAVQVAIAYAIAGARTDMAYAALLMALPDVGELMQQAPGHRPAELAAARASLRAHLSKALDSQLRAALASYDASQPFSPDAASAGRRSFHAACLDLIAAGVSADREAIAAAAFSAATNMTDTMAALSALSQTGGPAWHEALEAFETRWRDNGLVMDKWFAVRAGAASGDPLATVAALRQNPSFTLANPNRVRSLAAPFALRNHAAFHREDGAGYRFLTGLIADVDARNPALAAGMCKLLETVALAHASNRAAALDAIAGLQKGRILSANTSEILGKIESALRG